MTDYQDDRFLARWLEGDLTESELRVFEQSEDYANLQQVLAGVDQLAPQAFDGPALLGRIKHQLAAQSQPKAKVRSLRPWYMAAAAAIVALVAAVLLWPRTDPHTYLTQAGEKLEQSLPDQSRFTLNAQSELAYDAQSWEHDRMVKLEGEAYFEVEKGQRFLVETPLGRVQVLGTRFNVKARGQVLEVRCYEGKVAVSKTADQADIVLEKGRAVRFVGRQLTQQVPIAAFEADMPQWRKGMASFSTFSDITVAELIDELNRQFGVDISYKVGVDLRAVAGQAAFPHDNLDSALKVAFKPLDIRWKKQGEGKILLYK